MTEAHTQSVMQQWSMVARLKHAHIHTHAKEKPLRHKRRSTRISTTTCWYLLVINITVCCIWNYSQIKHVFHPVAHRRQLHHLHELRGLHGMKQTYTQMPVFIVHRYHVEADKFGHGQHNGDKPYQSYFSCGPHRNADAFHPVPGYHGSVSAKSMTTWGLFVCKLLNMQSAYA